jgi:lambda repressor-like predicted transcriptional regulator
MMMKKVRRKIMINGVEKSLEEIEYEQGIPYNRLLYYHQKGVTDDHLIEICKRQVKNPGLRALSRKTGIPTSTLWDRLEKGMSIDEAINSTKNKIIYQGKLLSLKELSVVTGIPYSTLRYRYKQGWDINCLVSPILSKDLGVEG